MPHDPETPTPLDPLYSVRQAAAATGLPERTCRELFNRRYVPLVRIGSRLYVRRSDMLAYIDRRTTPAAGS